MFVYQSLSPTEYIDLLVDTISSFEGHVPRAMDLKDGKATIGYGYTFERPDNAALWEAAGINLDTTQASILARIDAATSNTEKTRIALAEFNKTISKDQAIALLRVTFQKYEGPADALRMPPSRERVAFVSLTYNRGEGAALGSRPCKIPSTP